MIQTIQLSVSSRCNLHCAFCLKEQLRLHHGGFYEGIDLPLEIAKKVIDYPTLQTVVLCPNRGEPVIHPQILEIINYAKERGLGVEVNTNGSIYKPSWWFALGKILNGERDDVLFALDGINDKTHKKYRESNYYRVMENMEAFISGGGNATWQFIRFDYNQDQVHTAEQMAKHMGCKQFFLMNSHTYDREHGRPQGAPTLETTMAATHDDVFYPCNNEVYYVSCKGILFPCCFTNTMYAHEPHRRLHGEKHLVEMYEQEEEFMNLKNNDIDTILEGSNFIKTVLKNRFKAKVCIERCKKFNKNVQYRGEI